MRPPAWAFRGSCGSHTLDLWYSPAGVEPAPDRILREGIAKRICESCPVKDPCLNHARTLPEVHGIWGGMTEWERAGNPAPRPGGRPRGSRNTTSTTTKPELV